MKVKTSELSGAQLDRVVAKCESNGGIWYVSDKDSVPFIPSRSWTHGGPVIEQEKISLEFLAGAGDAGADVWIATRTEHPSISEEQGDTPLVAAMRCFVASKLGDEVEVPDALA